MIPRRPLDQALSTFGQVGVLRVLCAPSFHEASVREMARRAGVSAPQTEIALRRLEGLGLASWRSEGRTHLWRMNRDHVLAPALSELFHRESRVVDELFDEVRRVVDRPGTLRAMIFGSVARGTSSRESDLDLYVVAADPESAKRLQAELLSARLGWQTKYDTMVSPLIVTEAEERTSMSPTLLANIERDSTPLLGGSR